MRPNRIFAVLACALSFVLFFGSFAEAQTPKKPKFFSTIDACYAAVEAEQATFYEASDLRFHDNGLPDNINTFAGTLPVNTCVDANTANGRNIIALEKGTMVRVKRVNGELIIYAMDKCGNLIHGNPVLHVPTSPPVATPTPMPTPLPSPTPVATPAPAPPPPVTVTLVANPASVTFGFQSTLKWVSKNAVGCLASDGWTGTKVLEGSEVVMPTKTTEYSLSCADPLGNTAFSKATVTVNPAPAKAKPEFDFVKSNKRGFCSSKKCKFIGGAIIGGVALGLAHENCWWPWNGGVKRR